jgi:hypothetical protein
LPIKEVQSIGCRGEEIPNAKRVHQDRRGIDRLSDGPENGATDCGNGEVKALLPEEAN